MAYRPRPHLLLSSLLLWFALPLLKVCCYGISETPASCCTVTARTLSDFSAPEPPPTRHSSPCCSGASYLSKEDTAVTVDHTRTPPPHSNPPYATIPLHPTAHAKDRYGTPQHIPVQGHRHDFTLMLRTCSPSNAPPQRIPQS